MPEGRLSLSSMTRPTALALRWTGTDRLNVYVIDITENLHAMEQQMIMEKHNRNRTPSSRR